MDGKLKHREPAQQQSSVAANTDPAAPDDAAVDVQDLSPNELEAQRAALDQAISRAEQRAGHPVKTSLEK